MRSITKSKLVTYSLLLCGVAAIVPLFLREKTDSLVTIVSLSVSAVSTVATVLTLVIALFLYDRFGLESKFIEKQAEKVLELVDLLKGKAFVAKGARFHHFIRPSTTHLNHLKSLTFFREDRSKVILFSPEDFEQALYSIRSISKSYWLPPSIKEKLAFLEIAGFVNEGGFDEEGTIPFELGSVKTGNYQLPMPQMTFEQFVDHLIALVNAIEEWLRLHSDLPLDLKLEEPIYYKSTQ